MNATAIGVIIFSYLLGSIPTGMILAKIKGIDLRSVGSGNIGATNALRAMGKLPALITLIGDIAKGGLPVWVAGYLGLGVMHQGLAACASVIGHNFPVFLGFKGGKGVATTLGAILIYLPLTGILTVGAWLISAFLTRYSSLSALVAFGLMPLNAALLGARKEAVYVMTFLAALLYIRHAGNIKRLLQKTESGIGERP